MEGMKGRRVQMITNYEVQEILNDNKKLQTKLDEMSNVEAGSGSVKIHKYALKQLLSEIVYLRQLLK